MSYYITTLISHVNQESFKKKIVNYSTKLLIFNLLSVKSGTNNNIIDHVEIT